MPINIFDGWKKIKPWNREFSGLITHASNTDGIVEIPSYNLYLRLRARQMFVDDINSIGKITWAIKNNQIVFPFYNAIRDVNNTPVDMTDDILIYPGQEIELNIANSDGAVDYIAGAILWGEMGYFV